jgi:transcriptional regulator of NAD metabolism
MDEYKSMHVELCDDFIKEIEERVGRSLTESQRQGIYNSGTFMFLEAMSHRFYYAKTDEDVEKFLSEIDGFTREQS